MIKFQVAPIVFNDDIIAIDLTRKIGDATELISRDIYRLKEEGVKAALKHLGWASPEEVKELRDELERLRETHQ